MISEPGTPETTQHSALNTQHWFFWLAVAGLTAIYLSVAFYHIREIPLLDPDEPRYAGAGRAMARGGSLLVPEFNGQPRINKPPLFYWLVAASDTLAGAATEVAARLPSIALGLFALWGTVWLGRVVFGPAAGLLAGLILATTPLFVALSRCCITDMTLAAFMSGALGCLMLGMLGLSPPRRALWLAAALLGLAVLTKATAALAIIPVLLLDRALALPASQRPRLTRWLPWLLVGAVVVSGVAEYCEYRRYAAIHPHSAAALERTASEPGAGPAPRRAQFWSRLDTVFRHTSQALAFGAAALLVVMAVRAGSGPLKAMPWRAGLALALVAGAWWYAVLIADQGFPRFRELLRFEIGQRLTGDVHREPMHYYPTLLFALTFPWSLGLLGALSSAWPKREDGGEAGVWQRADRFLLAWLLGIVFFFSIPGAKLATYILPAMPAAALLLARFILRLAGHGAPVSVHWKRVTLALAAFVALVLLAAPLSVKILPKEITSPTEGLPLPLWQITTLAAVMIAGGWAAACRGRSRAPALAVAAFTLFVIAVGLPVALPTLNGRSNRALCARVKADVADCGRVATLGVAGESLSYYLDHPVQELQWRRSPTVPGAPVESHTAMIAAEMAGPERTALFIHHRYFKPLFGPESRTLTPAQLAERLPPQAQCVYADANVLVVKPKP